MVERHTVQAGENESRAKSTTRRVCLLLLVLCAAGCSTTADRLAAYEQSCLKGDFKRAESRIPTPSLESKKPGDLLGDLHAGAAARLAGAQARSSAYFDRAEDTYAKNDTASVFSRGTAHGLALLANDMVYPYDSAGVERVFCSIYKALNEVETGNPAGARTEFNRAQQRQEDYLFERRKQIAAARVAFERQKKEGDDKVRQQGGGTRTSSANWQKLQETILGNRTIQAEIKTQSGVDVTADKGVGALALSDYANVYVYHLGGVFRWLSGDPARGSLKTARDLRPDLKVVREDFAACDAGRAPGNNVWVYVEDGLCPRRDEFHIDLPLGLIPFQKHLLYLGMALPKLVERRGASSWYRLRAGGRQADLPLLQDVDRLVRTDFKLMFKEALAREVVRVAVSASLQIISREMAERAKKDNNSTLWEVGQIAVALWSAASKGADIRSWTALPKRVYAGRIPWPADNQLLIESMAGNCPVALQTGKQAIVWIRWIGGNAPPVVRVIVFN